MRIERKCKKMKNTMERGKVREQSLKTPIEKNAAVKDQKESKIRRRG